MPNERDALNRLLAALGSAAPPRRAYSTELAVDEAVTTGQLVAIGRAILSLAFHTTEGFFVGVALLCGYLTSISFLLVAILKPIFPNNVGVFTWNGEFRGSGFEPYLQPGHGRLTRLVAGGIQAVAAGSHPPLADAPRHESLSRARAHRRQLAREGLA